MGRPAGNRRETDPLDVPAAHSARPSLREVSRTTLVRARRDYLDTLRTADRLFDYAVRGFGTLRGMFPETPNVRRRR